MTEDTATPDDGQPVESEPTHAPVLAGEPVAADADADADADEPDTAELRGKHRIELCAAILLGLAATMTAYAAYRASIVGDGVLQGYSDANQSMQEGYDSLSAGDQASNFEQSLFLQYAVEFAAGNDDGALYLRETMGPEMLALVEVWENDPDDTIATPFEGDYAEIDDLQSTLFYAEGDDLLETASVQRSDAEGADGQSDIFELSTVLVAITLFLAGIAALITVHKLSWALLGVSAGVLAAGTVVLIQAELY